MKPQTILISVGIAAALLHGQAMKVHTKGTSTPQSFPLSTIDSITFELSTSDPGTNPNPGTLVYPADLLNLTNWKITLPIGTSGSPTEIKQPALATYKHDEYFHLNAAKTGVVFKAHCGGVTTSGSSYPRSELREMTSNGTAQASWSTTSGTHTMFLRQAITHIPDTKKHVVAGQVHDGSDDVIVIRLEGAKLFVDHNGADGPTLTTSYQLGSVFTVRFVASGGRIKIYYNDGGTPSDDYAKSTSGCYFKAGCYTQASSTVQYNGQYPSPTEYGEVIIYDLQISHN